MKKNNQMTLRRGVYSIVAVVVALAPFTMVNADIATGTSPGQNAIFNIMGNRNNINSICSQTDGQAGFACSIVRGGAAGVNNTAQQLSPQAAMQAETVSITSPYQFIRSVNQQVQKLRDCNSGERRKNTTNKRNLECNDSRNSGGGSSSDAYGFIGPFGISFSGGGGFGDQNTTAIQTGFKIDTRQANLMIDYSFNQTLTGGFAFNYLSTDRTLGLNSGTLNSNSYRFAPFLSYTPTQNSYITLMGGYARVDFDSTRKVTTLTDAKANYGADEYFASLGAGYTWRADAWSLRGYGRGDYNHLNIGSFKENGGIASDGFSYTNKINGQSILSATTTLGAELSYSISTNTLAAVIIPKFHAEWVHEFKNNGRQNQTTFNASKVGVGAFSSPLQSIAVAGPERNWANVGFGVQMLFPHAIVGYLNYDTLFIENASNQTVSGGFRINF
jgi:uncharacterized protein with beta-barrel porin domain